MYVHIKLERSVANNIRPSSSTLKYMSYCTKYRVTYGQQCIILYDREAASVIDPRESYRPLYYEKIHASRPQKQVFLE